MKKILIITAIFSFAFSTTYTNKNTILETKLNRIQNKWVVTNAYVMKGKVKKDALKEFHSTQFEFKKNNKLKITDSKRRNKSDYGSWEFNGLNSLRIHLYESNINFTIDILEEDKLKLTSEGKRNKKVISFKPEKLF